ncbi:D-alanyl-D-alanine carboxypeptidase/D-alanyl-D-alanine-endopeptidase [Sphingomonas sp. So64.6b]|uniref:D-alanyl-D-alanine carboxypeptidase/D-alanyl-D-alanine endopeptidase n=1 Tax=Sphingomonas sp. So64.6b TaxID=2997354 RepID=UPI0016034B4F|nr:D-alanyl-D-alanine carboxypeptidase/D-alanyl-D-alanine-endopeptidase [Sphingomonas sp. So64.6b]QNA83209.1 D-alanyl-D-alanine carboxypeptidase/D-alanyl-D-alanine-endopeptidase [Sphingomonas sp. So64.6b]
MTPSKLTAAILVLTLASPLAAQDAQSLKKRVETALAEAAPGTRFGLVVTTEDGREIVAINPDQRFIPASNTKIFTTAAAFATLSGLDQPDTDGGTAVRLDRAGKTVPDIVLEGRGDARLSNATDCAADCLATLADAVAAKARVVHDVIGDDSIYPDQRWGPGMSWNNIPTRSGTATSALTLDDNELPLQVTPGAVGAAPRLDLPPYYTVDNRAVTVAKGKTDLQFDRAPNGTLLRLSGTILADAKPELLRLGIDDPAHYTAWTFKRLLEARGVRVTGAVMARHRPLGPTDDPAIRQGAPAPQPPRELPLAQLTPLPLIQDLTLINKVSQNLHAELMLRRVGHRAGSGSIADGAAEVRAMLERAGVPRTAYDFSDGSGMSSYNRVAPRGVTILLRWIASQPWGVAFRETLPIGGVDGTLSKRFNGTMLERKLFAKTGTLNASSALSGYMTGKSGRTLIFSAYANDMPDGTSATKLVDRALELIAAEN